MSLTFRPVLLPDDVPLLHTWVTAERARFWDMQGASRADVEDEYRRIEASGHHRAFLGLDDGLPTFLAEVYDPAHDPVGEAYEVQPGDRGMHLLVGPTDTPVHGYTRRVMEAVVAFVLTDPDVRRVVVEPDVRNEAIHRLNASVGFCEERVVSLPTKDALLSSCTREDFAAATARPQERTAR
ncbi:GNAT family N-acetyltransferase [Solicola sp. PLA-1-18]|uniref:GNAT family N-acetyltransferase n=1 Tax=Solicola sp. PLA-1-18 TaxID=3380532 RepID=UPI003B801C06